VKLSQRKLKQIIREEVQQALGKPPAKKPPRGFRKKRKIPPASGKGPPGYADIIKKIRKQNEWIEKMCIEFVNELDPLDKDPNEAQANMACHKDRHGCKQRCVNCIKYDNPADWRLPTTRCV